MACGCGGGGPRQTSEVATTRAFNIRFVYVVQDADGNDVERFQVGGEARRFARKHGYPYPIKRDV